MKKMNKDGFEFSFVWLFAIIVGAFIIFIAIYFTMSVIRNSGNQANTFIAAELDNILSSVETNIEEGKLVSVGFPDEARIYNDCRNSGDFGTQSISTSVRSNVGEEWPGPGVEMISKNKYVFSESIVQGQEAHVFIKPFEMPYKVADLIMIYSGKHCFVNAPDFVEEEIEDLKMPEINVSNSVDDCPEESKVICFFSDNPGCDKIVKDNQVNDVYYNKNLIYAGIFADEEIYECQLHRLMKRDAQLAGLYADKAELLDVQGCSTGLNAELNEFANILIENYKDSSDLGAVELKSNELEDKNDLLKCKLF